MIRYSIIHEKDPREIIMLRGIGCRWRRCTFCDHHLDCSKNEQDNLALNRSVMSMVSGIYHRLEVINSGSFQELGPAVLTELVALCREKNIHTCHFECHWLYRDKITLWRKAFARVGTQLKIKTGVEDFDYSFRENILRKGITETRPDLIAGQFDECCLLFGLSGQSAESIRSDIETGLKYFERVCVNIFVANQTEIKPDNDVIEVFIDQVMPYYTGYDRVDILLDNNDFGVGAGEE